MAANPCGTGRGLTLATRDSRDSFFITLDSGPRRPLSLRLSDANGRSSFLAYYSRASSVWTRRLSLASHGPSSPRCFQSVMNTRSIHDEHKLDLGNLINARSIRNKHTFLPIHTKTHFPRSVLGTFLSTDGDGGVRERLPLGPYGRQGPMVVLRGGDGFL